MCFLKFKPCKQRIWFDKCEKLNRKRLRNNEYAIDDAVLVRNHKRSFKIEPEFLTGYHIIERVNDYTYIVENNTTGRKTKLHIEDLKLDVREEERQDE